MVALDSSVDARVKSQIFMGNDGYLHPLYASSFSDLGSPLQLPGSGAWVIRRPIGNTGYRDAMGCYPIFACQNWAQLASDLSELEGGEESRLVSLVVVTDPFGDYSPEMLHQSFPHRMVEFKEHFVVDLERQPGHESVCSHHRRLARRALQEVQVETWEAGQAGLPSSLFEDWCRLYDFLIERHHIRGISSFSPAAFEQQLAVPGLTVFRAVYRGEAVAMQLWYRNGEVAYYHLGASDARGYQLHAAFALFWTALEWFSAHGARWLDLGSGPGSSRAAAAENGLARFKRGWASGSRTAYLCGRILDPLAYRALSHEATIRPAQELYFPAYRAGEFR